MGRGNLERAAYCDSALFFGSGREARETYDVADCVNMLDGGLIVAVGFHSPARVSREAGRLQIQIAGRPVTARARQGFVGDDLFSACQASDHAVQAVLPNYFYRRDFFSQPQRHAAFAQMVNETLDYFRINEIEQP